MKDTDELGGLVSSIASYARKNDYINLYKSLLNSEIYVPIANKERSTSDRLQFPYTTVENKKMVMFYTGKDDARLGKPFSGMLGYQALKMILDDKNVDGILLQSTIKKSWFAITKEQIKNIIG